MKKTLLFGLVLAATVWQSQAAKTINFDDLVGGSTVPTPYQGMHWTNFFYLKGTSQANTGFQPAVITAPNVAFDGGGTPAWLAGDLAGVLFAFDSVYLTSVWRDNLQVEVIGFRAGSVVPGYDRTVTLSATTATSFVFDYNDVDTVEFIPSGGTQHPGYSSNGTQFAMDNIVIPEPTTAMLLVGFGAGALWLRRTPR